MKVSVNRELTVLTKRVCGIISQGDTSVNTTKTITTTTYTEEGGTKDVHYSLLSTPPFGGGGGGGWDFLCLIPPSLVLYSSVIIGRISTRSDMIIMIMKVILIEKQQL